MAASAALVAAGVLAVGQFGSGGRPEVANAARAGDSGSTPPTPAPDTAAPAPVTTPATTSPADDEAPEARDLDGQITIQIGDGDPIVIDLGDLGALAGEGGGLGDLGNIEQCVGDLSFDIDLDAAPGGLGLPGFDVFGDGDTMTITGPDGLSVLTFGDGDGSVTITKNDGEISISSDGDVQVDDLATAGDSLPLPSLPSLSELPDFDHIYECLEDAIGNG